MSVPSLRLSDHENGSHSNRYVEMEHRLKELEDQAAKKQADAGLPDMLKMAETSFNTVLAADKHQDEKAGRILSAMAFLTAAAAGIYGQARANGNEVEAAKAAFAPAEPAKTPAASDAVAPSAATASTANTLTPTEATALARARAAGVVSGGNTTETAPPAKPAATTTASVGVPSSAPTHSPYAYYRSLFGIDLPLTAFALYIFFVLLGSALYFAALGPSLNKPRWFVDQDEKIKSLIFFDFIDRTPIHTWREFWLQDPENHRDDRHSAGDLQRELFRNYVTESYIIAGKVSAKLEWMSVGSFLFKAALTSLALLVATLILPVTRVPLSPNFFTSHRDFFAGLCLGAAGLSLIFAYEVARRRRMMDRPTQEQHQAEGGTLEGVKITPASVPRDPLATEKSKRLTTLWLGLAALSIVLFGIILLRG